ncbi:MAG TPA: sulfolactaldehyde 3-reductase [Pararhizobium sp.]|nr:sulfolactaldehyde 3-reductase [Pararhizobium sp.]
MSRIGFIGVGTMGAPMAHNIAKGGHEVRAYDINASAVEALADVGIRRAQSAIAAADGADILITMLPNSHHVEEATFGENGFAAALSPDALYIDMSTIAPATTDSIGARMAERGIAMVDAPVGRQQSHAVAGKLMIMVGGADEAVARARPVLELMGDTIIHCGRLGMGVRMKVVNNYMSIALNSLSAEALVLAERSGLDPNLAREVMLGTAAGQGHFGGTYPAKVLKGDLTPGFMVDLAQKDMGLALDLAASLDVSIETGTAARAAYDRAQKEGRGREDWTAIYASARRSAGLG